MCLMKFVSEDFHRRHKFRVLFFNLRQFCSHLLHQAFRVSHGDGELCFGLFCINTPKFLENDTLFLSIFLNQGRVSIHHCSPLSFGFSAFLDGLQSSYLDQNVLLFDLLYLGCECFD